MKKLLFLSVMLSLLLAAPLAHADVLVFPIGGSVIYSPYQEESRVQMVPQRVQQPPALQPCACATPQCPQQTAAVQQPLPPPPPLPPQPIIAREDRTVYFGFNKDQLDSADKNKLNSLANYLRSDSVTGTNIVGYADRIGSTRYNDNLSRRRAEHVQTYLLNSGLIKPSGIETRWVGKSEPSTHCSKYLPRKKLLACLQPDRKVEVKINYRSQPQQPQPVYQPQPLSQPIN